MPNGGPAPDCIHCKFFRGRPFNEGEPYCTHHNIPLVPTVYTFCAGYIDPEPDEKGDWLDQMLEIRENLRQDTMYLWLGGYDIKFFHVSLASLADYATWTTDRFAEELEKLVVKYNSRLTKD